MKFRIGGAGENMLNKIKSGIRLEPSPAHATQIDGVAERSMQSLGTRALVLLFRSKLLDDL